jgi:osomolarity two-component system sensor histidine kinase NIK1
MLTSKTQFERQLPQDLDVAELLLKPVKPSDLLEAVLRILKPAYQIQSGAAAIESFNTAADKNILLVEDNPDNQKLAIKILEKAGYHVDLANNGEVAIELFQKQKYDLILMDVYMPVMDGFEATEKIRDIEKASNLGRTAIIALTAHAVAGYRQECLQNNMDDYLSKPLKKQTLFQVMDKWLNCDN